MYSNNKQDTRCQPDSTNFVFFTIKEIFLIIYSGMEFDFRDKYSNPALFNLETSDNRLLFVEEKQLGKVTNFGMIVVLPWWGQQSCLKFPVVQFK